MKVKKSFLLMISICLILVFASLSLLGGCGETAPLTETVTSIVTETPEVYEFKFLDFFGPTSKDAKMDEILGEKIAERTGGQVQIIYYHAEALGKQGDFVDLVRGGVTDIVRLNPGAFPGVFPMENIVQLPGIGIGDRTLMTDLSRALLEEGYFPGFEEFKFLGTCTTPPMNLYMKKEALGVDDIKGVKIRAGDANVRRLLELAGAEPLFIPFSECYLALERGVMDAEYTAHEAVLMQKYYEIPNMKYWIQEPTLTMGTMSILMNMDSWNRLPANLQAEVDKAVEDFEKEILSISEVTDEENVQILEEKGCIVYSWSPEECAKLESFAEPVIEEWIAEREDKGLPAQEAFDFMLSYISSYK